MSELDAQIEAALKFSRHWSMPNRWTFKMKPVQCLLERYGPFNNWADPFCGESALAEFKNDLNPENKNAKSHKWAKDFLREFDAESLDGVLFDPPYSPRQISECYKSIGIEVNMRMTQNQWSEEKSQIARIIKKGGICISFGWNTNGIGKNRGFEIIEIMLIAHGGGHNDTIITVERKI